MGQFKWVQLLSLVFALTGCAQGFEPAVMSSLASDLNGDLGCRAQTRSQVFDSYYQAYESQQDLSGQALVKGIDAVARQNEKLARASEPAQQKYKAAVSRLHALMTEGVSSLKEARLFEVSTQSRKIETGDGESAQEAESDDMLHLIRLEMRSQIDPRYQALNNKLDAALADAQSMAQELGVECEPSSIQPELGTPAEPRTPLEPTAPALPVTPPTVEPPPSPADDGLGFGERKPASTHPLHGAYWTMATAYQSCQSLELPLVTESVETVQGVIRATQVDAVGWGRQYTDLPLLKKTHYYHRGQTYGGGCLNQDRAPLVYDYGGKAGIDSASGSLDLFVNSGGGTALGIDCSAFVSAAAAVAGNRYKEGTANKPIYTRFASRDFIDPVKSGWTCYERVGVSAKSALRPGDIAAVEGHVVMIDRVGADPFGLARIETLAGCENVATKNFDFSVIQSSPSKEHLGINRYIAKDYLLETKKMSTLFLDYAKQACRSKFDGVTRVPKAEAFGIIRHKQTASCLAPAIKLRGENCIASCSSFN